MAENQKNSILWPGMIFVLLGMSFCAVAVTVTLAIRAADPGIEPDYYQKALDWDSTAAQLKRNTELGWSVEMVAVAADNARTITLDITDDQGRPLEVGTVSAEIFANTHASERVQAGFTETEPGRYRAEVPITHAGLWTVRVRVEARSEVFTAEGEVNLSAGPP